MVWVLVGGTAAAIVAAFVYLGREHLGGVGVGLAALRTTSLAALLVLLLNPGSLQRLRADRTTVLLDGSLSMNAAGGQWAAALDSALALAGDGGEIVRFGDAATPGDTAEPAAGRSLLRTALQSSVARGTRVVVVTDGEIEDAATLPPGLTAAVTTVLLPRDTVADAALLDVVMPSVVQQADSVPVTIVIGTWGAVDTTASLEVTSGSRQVLRRNVALPTGPGVARRVVTLPAGALPVGTHVVRFRLTAPGDAEPSDDERLRVVTVTTQPAVIVLVDPGDVEGRFLLQEVQRISRAAVRGYARVQPNRWVDMNTLQPVADGTVRASARGAGLLVIRGGDRLGLGRTARRVWHWPAGTDRSAEFFDGDWYLSTSVPNSPLAGRLLGAAWDSVPPLTGIVPLVPSRGEWTAVTGQLARRGADRPILLGHDSVGVRKLTTAGAGMWRWALRGGAAHEAYRAVLAAGVDWLLESDDVGPETRMTAAEVTPRGVPVVFRWLDGAPPDSVPITVVGADSTRAHVLRFDARRRATISLPPGEYRWRAPAAGTGGTMAVESYSDEFHPRRVSAQAGVGDGGLRLVMQRARGLWWLFVVAMGTMVAEWGWRQRRGLP